MIKLFEMFAGYGGASFALKKAGIEFECVGYSEIDKFAVQCYEQNHSGKNFGDCTAIDPRDLPDFDLLTGGFPCQSFSVAGKGLGERDTRGTQFHEIIRIAEVKKPRWILLENVKGLVGKKHRATFDKIISELERIGYFVRWKVLNSKEHGIPQNRERVWIVCFKNMYEAVEFEYPEKEELKLFLKDILEDEVDDEYYLSDDQITKLHEKMTLILNTMQGGHRQPFIVASRGRNPLNPSDRTTGSPTEQRLEPKLGGTTNALTTIQKDNWLLNENRIRKLTPCECFRLMGFLDDGINLQGLSNTQRYKLAGNGWDINVVSKIFNNLCNMKKEDNNDNIHM